ncbi:cardiolipin synthase [Zeaxanthinibacter enoshimensis]|uniref:Cardiolipin synthase n=1 Tax=Zeaxanthinibacter enoshimensis TaxID=392009 RepID=A0A4R6TQY0_9FLAO|nr:cardiolipin synthase [Zeaxanthinibacter enoshimensis]TDQ30900.1 cardiolipin synthase [Zeaxanthinibacter enoshimensis]
MLIVSVIILYSLVALFLVFSLLINGVRPAKTLGWLLAIFTIPVGGVLFYWMLGRNHRKNVLAKLKKRSLTLPHSYIDPTLPGESDKYRKLMQLINNTCAFPPSRGNEVKYLKNGELTFNAIFKAMQAAEKYIHLQYYIFEEGLLTDRLLQLFEKKVTAGVQVRLIYDGVGSYSLSSSYRKKLRAIGVEVYPFLPFKFSRFLSSINYRNHRKIIVVDGIIAFTGGINISDKYLKGTEPLGLWHDMHLQITGPSAWQLAMVFEMDWIMVTGKKPGIEAPKWQTRENKNSVVVQTVYSGPDDIYPNIEQVFLSLINSARKYIYITNPYIIPTPEILKALQVASLSGVDVRLLMSEKSDSKVVYWSVHSYLESMLRAGIRIFMFPQGFLHSKIIVSDDDIATIGTTNIDARSFEHNYEVNALVYDNAFSRDLRKDFEEDCEGSRELSYQKFIHRPVSERLKEGMARVFAPVL